MGFFESIMSMTVGRTTKRRQYRYQRDQLRHQKANIEEMMKSRETEDPREQAFQKQSMFGRGLGKSSIMEQEGKRLTDAQARRNASLSRAHKLTVDGLRLLKKKKQLANAMMWASSLDSLINLAAGAGGGSSYWGGGGDGSGGMGGGM